jgi:diadenylate cyclase
VSGLVTFVLGERDYATPLSSIREVVRLEGLADLPGMTKPLAGVLDLRGTALPVLDLRVGATADARGDVLVMEGGSEDNLVVDRLIEHFGGLQKLHAASIDDLQAVEGVGETRARSVREGLSRLAESSILERYV